MASRPILLWEAVRGRSMRRRHGALPSDAYLRMADAHGLRPGYGPNPALEDLASYLLVALKDAGDLMKEKLVERLQDIPGVTSVSLNLEDFESGIKVTRRGRRRGRSPRGGPGSLVAYGVRSLEHPTLEIGNRLSQARAVLGVDVRISEVKGGARVEVIGTAVRSFRLVPSTPMAIAQGVSDAWCQVLGRIPPEITRVTLSDEGA